MDFKNLLTDKVTVVNKDSTRHEAVRALVQPGEIIIADVKVPIDVGDRIERTLPSGQRESYIVAEPGFQSGVGGIPSFYQVKCHREGASKPGPVSIHVSGRDNTRVNVGTVDQSVNVSSTQVGTVFEEVRDIVRAGVAEAAERERLLAKVSELEAAHGTGSFRGAYKDFVSLAASHATILAPITAALAGLL